MIPTLNAGAVSTYEISMDGSLQLKSASIENGQTATCWINTAGPFPFAYTTNNLSDTISGYKIDLATGAITLLNDGVSAITEESPVDLGITKNGQYLYTVNAESGSISSYNINRWNGDLSPLEAVEELVEIGSVGIAVW